MSFGNDRVLVGGIQRFSVEDGPGIRTTVFFKGCPLECKWCHNPELISNKQQLIKNPNNCIACGYCIKQCTRNALIMDSVAGIIIDTKRCDLCLLCTNACYARALRPVAKPMSIDEIVDAVIQDKDFYDNTGGGVTLSGGEILTNPEFIIDLIDALREFDLNVCLDTSGFGDSDLFLKMALKENVKDIFYDMKSIDDKVHLAFTGVSNHLILDNLKMLAEYKEILNKITMRMPLISGVNDKEYIIRQTGEFYKEINIKRVNLLPYHNLGINKKKNMGGEQNRFSAPKEAWLKEIKNYFQQEIKLKVEILGVI